MDIKARRRVTFVKRASQKVVKGYGAYAAEITQRTFQTFPEKGELYRSKRETVRR